MSFSWEVGMCTMTVLALPLSNAGTCPLWQVKAGTSLIYIQSSELLEMPCAFPKTAKQPAELYQRGRAIFWCRDNIPCCLVVLHRGAALGKSQQLQREQTDCDDNQADLWITVTTETRNTGRKVTILMFLRYAENEKKKKQAILLVLIMGLWFSQAGWFISVGNFLTFLPSSL